MRPRIAAAARTTRGALVVREAVNSGLEAVVDGIGGLFD